MHKNIVLLMMVTLLLTGCGVEPPAPYGPCPSEAQLRWQRMEMNMFCHFGPNTFSGREWGDGTEPEDMFNPTLLDCHQWAEVAKAANALLEQKGVKGVYVGGTGPSYETPAEYKYFRHIGGDAVGMSTIPEVIVARHAGIPVFGISVITNEAHDDYADDYVNDGQDVVDAANAAAAKMTLLIGKMIEKI